MVDGLSSVHIEALMTDITQYQRGTDGHPAPYKACAAASLNITCYYFYMENIKAMDSLLIKQLLHKRYATASCTRQKRKQSSFCALK